MLFEALWVLDEWDAFWDVFFASVMSDRIRIKVVSFSLESYTQHQQQYNHSFIIIIIIKKILIIITYI